MTFFFVSRSSQKKAAVLLFWRLHIQVAFLVLFFFLRCFCFCGFCFAGSSLILERYSFRWQLMWERERDENSVLRAVPSLLFSFFVAFVFTYSFTMQIASLFFFFFQLKCSKFCSASIKKKKWTGFFFFFGIGALLFNSLLLCIFRHNSLFFCFCYFISSECFFFF